MRVNESGTYRCAVNMQGDESSRYTLTAETSGGKRETVTGSGQGWSMWAAPEVQIEANAGETITLRLEVSGGDGAYGSVDDCSIAMLMQPQTTAAPVTTTEPVTTTTESVTTTTEPVTTTTEPVTTTTESVATEAAAPAQTVRGDTNCDGSADIADAVLMLRYCVEDRSAVITDQGMRNADCDLDGTLTSDDISLLLRVIARLESF